MAKYLNNIEFYGVIYKVENKINGKIYIGQTIHYKKRKLDHIGEARRQSNSIFHKAINKYGDKNFEWSIIDECDFTYDNENNSLLDELEKKYIIEYNSLLPNGYNATEGGRTRRGFKMPKESIQKMINSKKGYICSDETREKLRIASTNRKCSDITKEKIRNSKKGIHFTDEHKQKLRDSKIGTKHTKSHIMKQRDNTTYEFFHEIYGIETCTQYELYTKYNLRQGSISSLIKGRIKSSMGWKINNIKN